MPTLALDLTPNANLGAFIPGVGRDYQTSVPPTVTSSAGDAALTRRRPERDRDRPPRQRTFSLAQPLQARALNAANQSTVFAPVTGTNTPLTLLTYSGPVSVDQVTIGLKQTIGANESLRTGPYTKTLTFTLSTTAP